MKARKILTIISISITFSLIMFNTAIVAIAFPDITKTITSTHFSEQWIINAYILSLVTFTLIAGKLCDIYSTKNIIITGLITFAISSIGCFFANDFKFFIFFRAIQGIASACLITPATKLLSDVFNARKFGKAIGMTTGYASIGLIAAPILGGITVQRFGWRWIFIINVALCIFAVITLLGVKVKSHCSNKLKISDIISFIIIAISLFCLVFSIMEGPSLTWLSPSILSLLSISIISFMLFIITEKFKKEPLIKLQSIINNKFILSNFIIIFTEALSISLIFLIMYMQKTLIYSPTKTGLLILPFYILLCSTNFISGFWINKKGPYQPLIFASTITPLGFAITFYLLPNKNYISIIPIIICVGISLGIMINATKTIIVESISRSNRGIAIGIQNNSRDISATISFAIFASIISYYKIQEVNTSLTTTYSFYNAFYCIVFLCLISSIIILLLSLIISKISK
tara:strand:- start:11123 stop:12502 length:1380 start_codon:yes stop_codon:yes gene_type:complete